MQELKKQISVFIRELTGVQINPQDFREPPNETMGDLSLPCFDLAKKLGKNPVEIANMLAESLKIKFVHKIVVQGPYLNIFLKPGFLNKLVVAGKKKITLPKDERKKIMLEYSQPNSHKEFHVGHLRNAVLGSSLVNILRWQGHKVVAANYIGDAGVHVAKCLWNLTKFHAGDTIPENKGEYLGAIYAEAVAKLEENEEYAKEVSALQKKLEKGDPELMKLWRETKEWSMQSFLRSYDLLQVEFDAWFYESEEEKSGRKLLKRILKENSIPEIKKSEGAIIADLTAYDLSVLVLIKSDGNLLYGAKDLPLAIKKFKKYKIDKSIYVVDVRQSLYLKQIFKVMDLFGYADKEKVHIPYDFVTLPEGAMASRKGNVVTFEKFYAEIFSHSLAETEKRHEDWTQEKKEFTAKMISLSAIKFGMLKYDNQSIIVFDVAKSLAFDGDTGPYLLYAIARVNSILRKESLTVQKVNYAALNEPSEKKLILHLAKFDETVASSGADFAPSKLCSYLLELARLFSTFYHDVPVLKAEPKERTARLALVERVGAVLREGLGLLNIDAVDEM
jgi:arginyl-tRNA synthetase